MCSQKQIASRHHQLVSFPITQIESIQSRCHKKYKYPATINEDWFSRHHKKITVLTNAQKCPPPKKKESMLKYDARKGSLMLKKKEMPQKSMHKTNSCKQYATMPELIKRIMVYISIFSQCRYSVAQLSLHVG